MKKMTTKEVENLCIKLMASKDKKENTKGQALHYLMCEYRDNKAILEMKIANAAKDDIRKLYNIEII